MRNLCFIVSYEGTAYYGFQTQPSLNTIQDKLEKAILKLTGESVKVVSSGRTDAGVHAQGQVFNFITSSTIPIERWCLALNNRLPKDIVVHQAAEVPLSFHSRRSSKRKTYIYTIRTSRYPDVFQRHLQYHHPTPLNIKEMKNALSYLVGQHDFSSFCSIRTTVGSRVRTIYEAWIDSEYESGEQEGKPNAIRIHITGNGFLYNMVRIIVGTLIKIGEGKNGSEDMREILLAKDRSKAGPTAEAIGLTLWKVEY